MIQGIHRRSGGGGAEAGEGRRAQHLLAGFGPSVREIPQVSLGDSGRQREGEKKIPERRHPTLFSQQPLYWFFFFSRLLRFPVAADLFIPLPGLWCCRCWRTQKLQSSSGSSRTTCHQLSRYAYLKQSRSFSLGEVASIHTGALRK